MFSWVEVLLVLKYDKRPYDGRVLRRRVYILTSYRGATFATYTICSNEIQAY